MGEIRLHVNFKDGGVLDASIGSLHDLEELQLREVPPDLVLPDELGALPKLRHLGMSGANDRLVIPALVGQLKLERLDVWDCGAGDLPAIPTLRHLEIVVKDPKTEVAILADRFPELAHLEVWGSHLASGELPDAIGRFGRLEVLALVSCGIATLPDAIANLASLRELQIRGVPMTQLPDVVARIPNLTTLRCGAPLGGLPASLAGAKALRELDLGHALNKGAMVSRWDDVSRLKALPKVLSELVALERLNLDCCGVFDLSPLRPLQALRALSVTWAAIDHVRDVAALARLEELSLEHCDRVKDLAPLAALAQLRVLNLDNTKPASLDVIRALPALHELHIESLDAKRIDAIFERELELHADDEVVERYRARAALRALPPIAEIVAAMDGAEVAAVEAALAQLAQWVTASSTRDTNAITAALGLAARPADDEDDDSFDDDDDDDDLDDDDDDDEEGDDEDDDDDEVDEGDDDGIMHARGGALPPLDRAIDRHLGALSPASLARVFAALFQSTSDDFPVAARIARELARRGDDAAQAAMVDAFAAANEYYDTGHRSWDDRVHDALIDDVFPDLRAPALAKLLAWCSDGHLDTEYGDHMQALFVPAFARAGDAERAQLATRLEAYVAALAEHTSGPAQITELWDELDAVPPGPSRDAIAAVRARLADRLAATVRRDELAKRLRGDNPTVANVLRELAGLSPALLDELQGSLWRTNRATQLDREARRALLLAWKPRSKDGLGDAIARMAAYVPVPELHADLDVLGLPAPELGAIVRRGIERTHDQQSRLTLDALRALAGTLDGMPPHVAASAEIRAQLDRAAQHSDAEALEGALDALAALDRYEPPPRDRESFGELATLIAHLAEAHEWGPLTKLARQLHKLPITGRSLERVLAQLVAVTQMERDTEGARALEPLIPAEVTWDILAYNLACASSVRGERAATLRFTEQALKLGKSPDQFLRDSDFTELRGDREFVALLDRYR